MKNNLINKFSYNLSQLKDLKKIVIDDNLIND